MAKPRNRGHGFSTTADIDFNLPMNAAIFNSVLQLTLGIYVAVLQFAYSFLLDVFTGDSMGY